MLTQETLYTTSTSQSETRYMTSVYRELMIGLGISALSVFLLLKTALFSMFFSMGLNGHIHLNILGMLALISPLIIVGILFFAKDFAMKHIRTLYYSLTALFGVSLAVCVHGHNIGAVILSLLVTMGTFGGLSIYGWTTKRDLSGVGTFCSMALLGVILFSLVGSLFHIGFSHMIMSIVTFLIFCGYTAYDTQSIKANANSGMPPAFGALSLYLDIINLFTSLLNSDD